MDTSNLRRPPTVPIEYAGKWIAWDHEQTKIVASAETFAEAVAAAAQAGEHDPLMAKVPRVDRRFAGAQL